jgi:hypothetical protein
MEYFASIIMNDVNLMQHSAGAMMASLPLLKAVSP